MAPQYWFVLLLVGAVSGWIASKIVSGGGLGLGGDIVAGIAGAFAGYWLLPKVGFHAGVGMIGFTITAIAGAILLLAILRVVRRL